MSPYVRHVPEPACQRCTRGLLVLMAVGGCTRPPRSSLGAATPPTTPGRRHGTTATGARPPGNRAGPGAVQRRPRLRKCFGGEAEHMIGRPGTWTGVMCFSAPIFRGGSGLTGGRYSDHGWAERPPTRDRRPASKLVLRPKLQSSFIHRICPRNYRNQAGSTGSRYAAVQLQHSTIRINRAISGTRVR